MALNIDPLIIHAILGIGHSATIEVNAVNAVNAVVQFPVVMEYQYSGHALYIPAITGADMYGLLHVVLLNVVPAAWCPDAIAVVHFHVPDALAVALADDRLLISPAIPFIGAFSSVVGTRLRYVPAPGFDSAMTGGEGNGALHLHLVNVVLVTRLLHVHIPLPTATCPALSVYFETGVHGVTLFHVHPIVLVTETTPSSTTGLPYVVTAVLVQRGTTANALSSLFVPPYLLEPLTVATSSGLLMRCDILVPMLIATPHAILVMYSTSTSLNEQAMEVDDNLPAMGHGYEDAMNIDDDL